MYVVAAGHRIKLGRGRYLTEGQAVPQLPMGEAARLLASGSIVPAPEPPSHSVKASAPAEDPEAGESLWDGMGGCLYCGAAPGEPCVTKSGKVKSEPHAGRV